MHFLDQHLEGFRDAGFRDVFALNNCFVDLDATDDVVLLDGQKFLQCIVLPIIPYLPDFHIT